MVMLRIDTDLKEGKIIKAIHMEQKWWKSIDMFQVPIASMTFLKILSSIILLRRKVLYIANDEKALGRGELIKGRSLRIIAIRRVAIG